MEGLREKEMIVSTHGKASQNVKYFLLASWNYKINIGTVEVEG